MHIGVWHRLASQLQGSLYSGITSSFPKFYFGFPKEKERTGNRSISGRD